MSAQRPIADRIAAAPVSWGICEVPGWGYQMPAEQVLSDIQQIGLAGTELGPDEFLPGDPNEQREILARFGLRAIGGFCPIILFDDTLNVAPTATAILDKFTVLGADIMVIAADAGAVNYDDRHELTDAQWKTLLRNVEEIANLAADRGVTACLHPHVGTVVETRNDVDQFLDGCDVPICFDTGHLLIGGSDPVQLARDVPHRIAHVQFKDVDPAVLATVRSGECSYTDGVRHGMYRVLGEGSIDLASIVDSLEAAGYTGYYVPEQDRMLASDADATGMLADAAASVHYLSSLG
jgi:inosose dehydratase